MNDAQGLMARLGIEMKKGRQRYWDLEDFVVRLGLRLGKQEASLFFRTRGCRHDRRGGCTMCDYSAGLSTNATFMTSYVRQGLDALPVGVDSILVSPSGSFLDPWEVPLDARAGILSILAERQYPAIAFETRAETVTNEAIAACRAVLPDRRMRVYCGLESSDPWVSRFAINKDLDLGTFASAMRTLAAYDIVSVANVLLGAPFLSDEEIIEDAVTSIQWAFASGAAEFCLFPCHVKRWTQVEWLYRHGTYHPPSLWSFIEVLRRLGPEIVASRGEIAWFTSYGAFNVLQSPITCDTCYEKVIDQLQGFADTNDYAFISRLVAMPCACKDQWMDRLESPTETSREERAAIAYDQIGKELYSDRWSAMRDGVLESLFASMIGRHDRHQVFRKR